MAEQSNQWTRLRSERGPDSGIFRIRFDYMRNPRNGKVFRMAVMESKDAVNILPLTTEGRVIMVRQYRFGVGQETLELPGGLIEEGEDQETAGRRELLEETGFSGGRWTYMGEIQSNPVFMDSKIFHWVAIGVKRETSSLSLDEGESIEVVELDKQEVYEALVGGLIQHPHVISALSRVFDLHRLPGFGLPNIETPG